MSKFTNAIKGMSKLKKVMVGMWLGVAGTLIALVAVLIAFGDKVSGKDRVLDAKTHIAKTAQYKITNPEITYTKNKQDPIAKLDIEQWAFDKPTDANFNSQADAISRFQFDVKARSTHYVAKYNTKTKTGNFFLMGSKDETEATAAKGWVEGQTVENTITNEVKIIAKTATPETGWTVKAKATKDEIIVGDLDGGIPALIPSANQHTQYYTVSRVASTIARTHWVSDVAAAGTAKAHSKIHTDTFALVFNADTFAFNDEAKNKSNATAAVGTVFALTLVGAIGVTVAESIYRKRGAK